MRVFLAGVFLGVFVSLLTGFGNGPVPAEVAAKPASRWATSAVNANPVAPVAGRPALRCDPLRLPARAAQALVVGLPEVTRADDRLVAEVRRVGVGGVFLTGYNVVDTRQLRTLIAALHTEDVPPFVATDEEAGRVSSFRGLFGFTSSPRTMAARNSPARVHDFARDLGRRLSSLGVDVDFAPVADLDAGPSSGVIGDRSFSADPRKATRYVAAFAEGLAAGGVVPVVKHFPGHGGFGEDPHSVSVVVDVRLAELHATHLMPFADRIASDAPVIMMSHLTYAGLDPQRPASMSPRAYALLRDLGFDGVAITDSVGMGAVHSRWDFPAAAEQAIRAGADAVLVTDGSQARSMRDRLVEAVRRGRLPDSRLNEAVARVLRLKGINPRSLLCNRR